MFACFGLSPTLDHKIDVCNNPINNFIMHNNWKDDVSEFLEMELNDWLQYLAI